MSIFKNPFTSRNILLLMGDILIAIFCVYAGAFLRYYGPTPLTLNEYYDLLPKAIAFAASVTFMSFFLDMYDVEKKDGVKDICLKVLISAFFASLMLGAVYYFIPSSRIIRGTMFFSLSLFVLIQSLWHIGYSMILELPVAVKKVLILGTGPIANKMGNIVHSNNNGVSLAGYVTCLGEPINVPAQAVVGNGDGILAIAMKEKVQQIVVSLSERRGTLPVREILNCKLQGIEVIDGPSFYEQMTGKLLIENINPSHLIFSDGFRLTLFRSYVKRMFDIIFATISTAFAIPFLLILPVLIKIDSKGPVFFKQRRIGEGEKEFMVYKFRTMVEGAETKTGPVWSQTGDSRITKLGRLLRKTRLDELPQLFNVIHGDMSFIGPRPERPFFIESLKAQIPYYSERHCVKPGITGWAQVRYEYGDSIEDAIEKLRYDLYYIKYQSISLDFLIILDTVKVILFGRGGR